MSSEKETSVPKHKIICDNTLDALRKLPKESIDIIMTSPPYWNLRDYGEGTATIWNDDENCEHEWGEKVDVVSSGGKGHKQDTNKGSWFKTSSSFCQKCNAWYGQLGLEPTPELYIEHLRMVFAEVKRVLKKTGTCWVNIGDTYSSTSKGNKTESGLQSNNYEIGKNIPMKKNIEYDVPQKCMCMIPERFAFMMIDLDYILRNKIIWHKPNPMPSSVRDRFNTTYEMLYFFSKNHKYWFDLDAVREEHKPESLKRVKGNWNGHREPMSSFQGMDIKRMCNPSGKNLGDFWSINTQSFPEAHFAVFPEKLCEKLILAGCPEPGVILDPFGGSGTISIEAEKLGRSSIIVDIKKEYCKMAFKRLSKIASQAKLDGNRSTIECINF